MSNASEKLYFYVGLFFYIFEKGRSMNLSNETYDRLKYIAQVALPALGTLIFGIASIWGLPYGEQIVGTITAIDAFLGTLLKLSSNKYAGDGTLVVDTSNPEKDIYSIVLDDYPELLANKDQVVLKVQKSE